MRLRALLAVLALVGGGCASTSPRAAFDEVASKVAARSGQHIYWNAGTDEDREVQKVLDRLLEGPLTAEQAVYVALLNNHTLQATYEELRIGQADLVQAGLLKNPQISAAIGFSSRTRAPNLTASVGWDFFDVFTRSARQTLAENALEAAKLRVGQAVLQTVFEVRSAYYTLVSARQVAGLRREVADAAQTAADLSRRQLEAGNVSELDLANQEVQFEQARLDLERSEADVFLAHEQLTRLLGLWGKQDRLRVPGTLPELPTEEIELGALEALAVAQRLDLGAARKEAEVLGQALSLARKTRYVGGTSVGASYERRPVEDEVSLGPSAGIDLPIFDQRQAQIARLDAQARRAEHRLAAAAVEVRSELRTVRARLVYLRRVAEHYRTGVLPVHQRALALSMEQYNSMLLGVYQLLATRQAGVNALRESIETRRDYWIARADLERAAGGRLFVSGEQGGVEPRAAAPAAEPPGASPMPAGDMSMPPGSPPMVIPPGSPSMVMPPGSPPMPHHHPGPPSP